MFNIYECYYGITYFEIASIIITEANNYIVLQINYSDIAVHNTGQHV